MRKTMLILAIVAGLLALPVVANAQTDEAPVETDRAVDRPVDFETAKERVLEAIDKRVDALDQALVAVAESEYLTEAHAATLTADYEFHRDGLLDLRPQVEAATTPEELKPLAEMVWQEHWVFALQIPKGRLTNGADAIVGAVASAEDVAAEFDAALAELEAAGVDVDEGWRLLNQFRDDLAAAEDRAAPVPDTVLAIQVTEMPDAKATLEQARDDLHAAHERMVDARDTAHELAEFIRSVIDA